MAENPRARKVADRIHEIVAVMIDRKLKDPRLGMVTVTDVRVTGDLQNATIFYTVLGNEADLRSSGSALESAKGMIRSEVGKQLSLRLTPTIEFVADALPVTAQSIEDALIAARVRDAELARQREGAAPAGDADPYKKPNDAEDSE
ncbi:MAG: 30S ribosome-binding factor RbfA [Flaviflexus sp.]|uniref:30S ribosome-binding factor RbfA n=1 Tax=Flaviflexus sp. TaxID=1969482 RepID=UPI00352C7B69